VFDFQERPAPVGAFIDQLMLVPIAIGILSLPLSRICSALIHALSSAEEASPLEALNVVLLTAIGWCLGLLVSKHETAWRDAGRFIWVVPVGFFLFAFIVDTLSPPPSVDVVANYFYPSGSDEGFTRLLVTDPAFSTIGYSLGLSRRWRPVNGR